MINNRPRGVFHNKNAANIQLASVANPTDNLFEKRSQRELTQQAPRVPKVDSENIITLASLKSISDGSVKGNMIENFDKQSLNNINLHGNNSPKEPSPPKLKSYTRQSLRLVSQENAAPFGVDQVDNLKLLDTKQHDDFTKPSTITLRSSKHKKDDLLIDISEENENENDHENENEVKDNLEFKKPAEQSKGPEKAQVISGEDSKQQSRLSRIPRLSLRFSNVPIQNNKSSSGNANGKINNDNNNNNNIKNILQLTRATRPQTRPALGTLAEDLKIDEEEQKEIEDIDKTTSRDAIFLVCDVAKDIFNYMYELEDIQAVRENYLKDQRILTPKVRQRLINWCIEINTQLKLLPETLYLTIATIDRFFDKFVVERQNQVQLFASAATLIASKYEEIYPPEVRDLVYLTQSAYTKREILRAEMFILKQLEFDLGKPIPIAFLRRFSKAAHCNLKMHSIAKYLMEMSLTEYECAHWKPSLLAAASLFTSLFLIAANKTESPTVRGLKSRTSLAPLSSSSSSSNYQNQITTNATIHQGSSSTGRTTRSSLSNTAVGRIVDGVWNRQMVHYTRYDKEKLFGPAGVLCKILRRVQKNPIGYYCYKKNAQEITKWTELKSTKVDDLIKISEQYHL